MCTIRTPISLMILLAVLTCTAGSGGAAFKVCNQTAGRVAVALGHNDTKNWLSEGWWQINAHECAFLIEGPLLARYYYIYAIDHDSGAEWTGPFSMCASREAFIIAGRDRCEQRGFSSASFREIDTGEHGEWTEYLAASFPPDQPRGR
jgi:uncharacterized membrane protein